MVLALLPADVEGQRGQRGRPSRFIARAVPEVGVRGGYDFDAEAVSVGAQARLPLGAFVELLPSGDYIFAGEVTTWHANLDVAFRMGFRQVLYAGAGGGLARRQFEISGDPAEEETRLGINLFIGASTPRFLRTPVRLYVEVRWFRASDFDAVFGLVAGLNLPLGGREP
ncbi:MAG: hypothetical protein GTN78_18805 [Gemmatimonadales bacterium]|nr:hypothetical protein [Gemmatimonadales bacterium]NIN12927.1 hypothetical protein [Gemmatimonadales bacterium]NIR02215.1 hypothetical protein [Gemmatimonadales bacterium]